MSVHARLVQSEKTVCYRRLIVLVVLTCLVWPAVAAEEIDIQQEQPAPAATQPPADQVIRVERQERAGEIYVPPPIRDLVPQPARTGIRNRIDLLWQQRQKDVLETGITDSGPESLQSILEELRQQDYSSMTGMEANLVNEAYRLRERKYLEQGRRSLQSALEIDPGYLPALSARAESRISRNPIAAPVALGTVISAISDSFWPALTCLVNLSLVLALTLLVMSFLLQLVMAARYQKRFRHSIYESWRERIPNDLLPMLSWCLFLAPLFLFLGPFWLFCFWTAVLWRFAGKMERLLAVLSLIVLSFLVPAVDTVEGTFRDLNTADLRLFSEALDQKLLSQRGETLIRNTSAPAEDAATLNYYNERQFLMAVIHQKMGRDDAAFDCYASIPVYSYLYPMAQNNIGNIYFSMNQFDLSIQHYHQAIDVLPEYAECYFNLSSAQFQVYDFDHSDQSLTRAQRLAPLAIGKLIDKESRGLRTLDHRIPRSFLWDLAWDALQLNAGRHFAGLGLLIPGGKNPPAGRGILVLPGAALLAALSGLLLGWINRHEDIGRCSSCGKAYCRHCGPDPLKQQYCQQCNQLDTRMSGVSPEIQKKKLSQIRRHQLWERLREGLLTVSVPGMERMRRGRTLSGALLSGVWIFLLAVIVMLPRYLPWIGLHTPPWSLNPLVLVATVLAVLLWVVSLVCWVVRVLRGGGWRLMGTLRLGLGQKNALAEEGEN